ncbi:MAG: PHP domain-containing protein [Candidatus Methanoperedens sp.]
MIKNLLESNSKNDGCVKFDFHIHSIFSYDSLSTPKRIVRTAQKRGLNGIAITDHETIKGAFEASKIDKKIEIIIGSEIQTDEGDIIGLFLNEEIKSRRFDCVIDEIREQDGFIILPHPYKTHDNIPDYILKRIDAIEIYNGRISNELNNKAKELAFEKKFLFTGGSDAHLLRDVGRVETIFNGDIGTVTRDNIEKVLAKCNVIGTESPRYSHYYTAAIGNFRKKSLSKIGKKIFRKILGKPGR